MPSISNPYKHIYALSDSACFVMSAVNVPDGSWVFKMESSNLESLQEFNMKLSVALESTKTCLSVVECEDFKRVGIHSDLYLLVKIIFNSTFSRHAQTNRVASFKNLPQNQPPSQFVLQWPYWWWWSSLVQWGVVLYRPMHCSWGFHNLPHSKSAHYQYKLDRLWSFSAFFGWLVCYQWVYLGNSKRCGLVCCMWNSVLLCTVNTHLLGLWCQLFLGFGSFNFPTSSYQPMCPWHLDGVTASWHSRFWWVLLQ